MNHLNAVSRPAPVTPVRVLVVDDDPTARRALRQAVDSAPAMTMAGEASTGAQALEAVRRSGPDVVLMDADMPEGDGLAAALRIHDAFPGVDILMLASELDEDLALLALLAGATGFLGRDVPLEGIVRAARRMREGEAAISRRLGLRLIGEVRSLSARRSRLRPVESDLTAREWQVLDLLADGATTAQIAARLVLSVDTVRTHIKHVLRKLGAHSRAEAVAAGEALRGAAGLDGSGLPPGALDEATVRREFERLRRRRPEREGSRR